MYYTQKLLLGGQAGEFLAETAEKSNALCNQKSQLSIVFSILLKIVTLLPLPIVFKLSFHLTGLKQYRLLIADDGFEDRQEVALELCWLAGIAFMQTIIGLLTGRQFRQY